MIEQIVFSTLNSMWMWIRLGQFRRFPGSTRFQIENRNHGSTLFYKESGTRKRRFRNRDPIPKAGSGKIPGSGDRLGSNKLLKYHVVV